MLSRKLGFNLYVYPEGKSKAFNWKINENLLETVRKCQRGNGYCRGVICIFAKFMKLNKSKYIRIFNIETTNVYFNVKQEIS